MKLQEKINIPENLIKLALKLKNKAELFIVGGYVRNGLLGFYGTDIDLCSKLTPDKLKEYLSGTNFIVKDKNKKLGTVTITIDGETYEHSTFRVEEYDDSGKHCPILVKFVDDIRQDAKRRDFTINCLYYSILKNKIIDIYSGQYDLEHRRIRTIETPEFVFSKDGLRILRMIRIACELNFKIEKQTYRFANQMSYRLKDITGIRKQKELLQILDCYKKYPTTKKSATLRALDYFNTMQLWSFFYSTKSYIKLDLVKRNNLEKMPALLIDMINAINPECVEYYLDYMLASKGFDFTKKQQEYYINIVSGYFDVQNRLANKQYFMKYYDNFEKIRKYVAVKHPILFNKYNFFYKYLSNNHIPIRIKDLQVNGDDIKKCKPKMPEKYYGKLFKELLSRVFDGEINNTKEDLVREIKDYDWENS